MPQVDLILEGWSVSMDQGRAAFCGVTLIRGTKNILVDVAHVGRRSLLVDNLRKVGLEQVANERLIAYTLADYPEYHSWLADLFAPLKRPPKIAEEHDSSTSLIASVEAGRGVDEQVRFELHGFRVVREPFDVLDLVAKAEPLARVGAPRPAEAAAAVEAACR